MNGKLACFLLLFLAPFCSSVLAQDSTPGTLNTPHPDTATGPPSAGTVEQNAHEQLSLGTGSLSLEIPILSLPQAGGRTLTLGFVHSSNTWSQKQTSVTYGNSGGCCTAQQSPYIETASTVQWLPNLQGPWFSALHPNLPTLNADLLYAGDYRVVSGPSGEAWVDYPSYCVTDWVFTDWHGASHSFKGERDCTSTFGNFPTTMTPTEASDDSGYQIDNTNSADLRIIAADGTVYHFLGYQPPPSNHGQLLNIPSNLALNYYAKNFSSMVDPNGNTVTYSFATNTLTDTTGRQIIINSSATQTISWTTQATPTASPVTVSVTASDGNSGQQIPFPVNSNSAGGCVAKQASDLGHPLPGVTMMSPPSVYSSSTTTITLPDGTNYQLTYDPLNRLTKIRYPAGGYTRYEYDTPSSVSVDEGDMVCSHPLTVVVAKHECSLASGACTPSASPATANSCQGGVGTGGELTTCYTGTTNPYGWTTLDVTDPLMTKTEYTFSGGYTSTYGSVGSGSRFYPPLETERKIYPAGSTTTIRTIDTGYVALTGCPTAPYGADCASVAGNTTTSYNDAPGAPSSTVSRTFQFPHLPTGVQQQDFSGNLVNSSSTAYMSGGIYSTNPASSGALYNILDHVQSTTVTDSTYGKTVTATNSYDGTGNLIQTSRSATGAATATSKYWRDTHGNLTQVQDPMQFSGAHQGSTVIGYGDQGVSGCPHSSNVGLPTLTTNALGQSTKVSYYPDGVVACVQDANGNVTKRSYDLLGRPSEVNLPDGGQTTYQYASSTPLQVTSTQAMSSSASIVRQTILDGFARPVQSILTASSKICTETYYDAAGRVSAVDDSNTDCPLSSGAPLLGKSISYLYDSLDRKTLQTNEDGSTQHWQYSGTTVDSYDEANHHWRRTFDALGRLTYVFEPDANNSPSLETDYGYDGFGNLYLVNQLGISGETARSRSFQYDGFSRLITSANRETGAVCYGAIQGGNCTGGYDLNDNLQAKTDARGVTTSYIYDALNRMTSKQYSGGSDVTPSSCFLYETAGGTAVSNSIGRLVQEWTQSGACNSTAPASDKSTQRSILGYDAVGRILTEQRCILANCKVSAIPFSMTVGYDLAGNLKTYDNGLGTLTITNLYDGAGRLYQVNSSINDAIHPQSLYSISDFTPFGSPHFSALGGNISITQIYDKRLRPTGKSAVKQ